MSVVISLITQKFSRPFPCSSGAAAVVAACVYVSGFPSLLLIFQEEPSRLLLLLKYFLGLVNCGMKTVKANFDVALDAINFNFFVEDLLVSHSS